MIPGDIVEVRDEDGHAYEAKILLHVGGHIWRFEWLTGPNDTKQDVASFGDEADNWKVQ